MSNSTNINISCGLMPDIAAIKEWKFWICGIATLVVGVLGSVGNFLSIFVLCKKPMHNIFNHLLASLCIGDLLFLICNLLLVPIALGVDNIVTKFLYPIAECGCHILLSISIFLTIGITIERYQAVCLPHTYTFRTRKLGLPCLLTGYVLPSVFLAILLNIPRVLEFTSIGAQLQSNKTYLKFYMYYQVFHPLITTGVTPIFLLSLLNYKVYSRMPSRKRTSTSTKRRATELKLARICCAIVLLFIICNIPRLAIGAFEVARIPSILNCYDFNKFYFAPTTQWLVDFIGRYLAIINSSINFVIYCLVGTQFRSQLLNMLGVSKSQSIPDIRLEEASTHDPSGPGEVLVKMKHTISSLELLPLTSPDSRPVSPSAYSSTSSKTVSQESLQNDRQS